MTTSTEVKYKLLVPQTLGALLLLLLRGIFDEVKARFWMMVGVALLGLFVHTVVLVGPNEGFNRMPGIIGDFVAARSNEIGGLLIWTLAPIIVISNYNQIRENGFAEFLENLKEIIVRIQDARAETGGLSLPLLLTGCGLGVGVIAAFNNNLLGLVLFAAVATALASFWYSFFFLFVRMGWNQWQRHRARTKGKAKLFNMAFGYMITAGAGLGFLLGYVMPWVSTSGLVIAVALLVVSFFMFQNRSSATRLAVLVLVVILGAGLLSATSMAYADDGGWLESGGTLEGWMSSGAAEQAVAMGIFPSIGMVVGVLLVTTVVPMIMRVTTSQIKTVNASLSAFRQRAWQVSKIAATSPLMLELELEDAVIDLGKTLMDAALNGELAYILLPLNERPERDFVAGDAVEFGKLGIEVVTGAPVTGAIAPIKGFIDPGNIKSGQLHLEDFELPGTLEVRYAPVNQRFVIVAGQSFPVGFDPDEYEYDPETRCYHLPDMQPGEQPTY